MIVSTPRESFSEIYSFFKEISGSHNGILNNKIYQPQSSEEQVKYFAMTADFPNYGRLLGNDSKIAYHLSGYGCTREEALIRLIGESLERYSVVYSHAFLNKNILYATYKELIASGKNVMPLKYLNVYSIEKQDFISCIGDSDLIGWISINEIYVGEPLYIPAQMFFLGYPDYRNPIEEKRAYIGVSTGTATYTNREKAIENALIEYLQIDSFMLSWYAKDVKVPKVILDKDMRDFIYSNKLISEEYNLLVLDFTLDKPFPIFGIFITSNGYPLYSFGVQGGADPRKTLYRGLLEAATILQYNFSSYVYDNSKFLLAQNRNNKFLDLDSNVLYWASEVDKDKKKDFLNSRISGEISINDVVSVRKNELLYSILKYCRKNKFSIGCYEITCPEIGKRDWYVIRTIIPELLPMCLPGRPFVNHPRMKEYGGCVYELPHPLP